MKTVKIKFNSANAEKVARLLVALEITVIVTWCEEGLMDGTTIYCICLLNNSSNAISPELQIEKLRENLFIKYFN